ncbi:hypothetical protein [uncultured Chryseobacterium sp.]|uniref:hypothetical protein n=1 Tax=uncultured Chryseobacterium sp. TaxID=259322 RepID=UPI0025E62BCA|nr:hypothetical protein [uncultured Chryseobacterium sp.]
MAEKLYFIKTNPVVAKINLYNKLCREEEHVLQFLQDDKKTSLELIKKKTLHHIDDISKEELLDIFRWFDAKCDADPEELQAQLFTHGIDIFHEISGASDVEAFHGILADYEKHANISLGCKTDSEVFNPFLIYGIFFSGMINKNGEIDFHFDYLKSGYSSLYSLAETAYQEHKSNMPKPEMHRHFSELYDSTKFYKGNIIRLHRL